MRREGKERRGWPEHVVGEGRGGRGEKEKGVRERRESERVKGGQTVPFIASHAYLAVAR